METIEKLRARHARIFVGPLTKAAILNDVDELTREWKREKDPAVKERIDRRIDTLLSLIKATATALLLMLTAFPARAQDDGYGISEAMQSRPDAACTAYHDARQCLAEIKRLSHECVAAKAQKGPVGSDEVLACINDAIAEAGAVQRNGCQYRHQTEYRP